MAKCKNCINLENHWCDLIGCSPDENTERKCGIYERMTNADKIRAMSNEELADLFFQFNGVSVSDKFKFCHGTPECDDILDAGKYIPENMCKKCLIGWLQSGVEEEDSYEQ